MKSPGKCSRKVANLLRQLEHTGDGVFAVDRYHRIVSWNRAATTLLGYTAQEALGKNCHDLFRARDSEGVLICRERCSHFEVARTLHRLPNESFCAQRKDGTDVWINITTVSLLSQRGTLSTLVHLFRKADDNTGREKESAEPRAKSVMESVPPVRTRQPNSPSVPLTDGEQAVLSLLAKGLSTKAIGQRLCITGTAAKNHVQRILEKLQVHGRVEAVALAFHLKLL